jgi:hypothetical protein
VMPPTMVANMGGRYALDLEPRRAARRRGHCV